MEVKDDIHGQEDVTGLNNSSDSTQLIRTKLEVDTDELKFFRRLHVFLQQTEQHGEQSQGPPLDLWVTSLFHPTGHDTLLTCD